MTEEELRNILDRLPQCRLAVAGDFFVDKYLHIDPKFRERSIETGLEAYQVIQMRCQPGAGGTVMNNLSALGVGRLYAVTVIGEDGEGYEFKKGLTTNSVALDFVLESPDRFTPTYTKPLIIQEGGLLTEINRLDIRNRTEMPPNIENEFIRNLRSCLELVDGLIIADQVEERNWGLITDRVRTELSEIGQKYPEKIIVVDSRQRIDEFRNVIVKPNRFEAASAMGRDNEAAQDPKQLSEFGMKLAVRNHRPVYITLGTEGLLLCQESGCRKIPGYKIEGEIDIVGAGDSVTAGIAAALCASASYEDAGLVGNLVASITVQQIGTTGTASPEQVIERFKEYRQRFFYSKHAQRTAEKFRPRSS